MPPVPIAEGLRCARLARKCVSPNETPHERLMASILRFVLGANPLNVERIRSSIETWRSMEKRAETAPITTGLILQETGACLTVLF